METPSDLKSDDCHIQCLNVFQFYFCLATMGTTNTLYMFCPVCQLDNMLKR